MEFEHCWKRIQEKTDLKKQTDLASFLEISDNNITKAKKRGKFPKGWAIKIAKAFDLSTDWLLFGEGSVNRTHNELPEDKTSGEEVPKDYWDTVFDLSRIVGDLAKKMQDAEKNLKEKDEENDMLRSKLADAGLLLDASKTRKAQDEGINLKDFPIEKFMLCLQDFWRKSDPEKRIWLKIEIEHLGKIINGRFPEFSDLLK